MDSFDETLAAYLEFKVRAEAELIDPLKNDVVSLRGAREKAERMAVRINDFLADAQQHYYKAKADQTENWILQEARAVSTATEAAKARSHRELWLKTHTEGMAKNIESRRIAISQTLKQVEFRG